VLQPSEPVKLGYTFEGWFTTAGDKWNFALDKMKAEDVTLNAKWSISSPFVNPINPGDACVTGSGAPGSTLYIFDYDGNVIGTTTVDANGLFSFCDDSIANAGEITIELVDQEGNVSSRVSISKPGSGITNVLPETGINTFETFVSGILMIMMSLVLARKANRK
jgi:uncharacterized repeat protein (TIGR02543 family)/LPXTG-motif cell wall-anchored protein